MPRYLSALSEFSESDLSVLTDNDAVVKVKSSTTSFTFYLVDFCNVTCTCPDYKKLKQICKHFCACFIYLPTHGFDRLPQTYREDPENSRWEVDLQNNVNSSIFQNNESGLPSVESTCIYVKESEHQSNCERSTPLSTSMLKETLREILMMTIGMTYNLPEDPANVEVLKTLVNQATELKSYVQKQQNNSTENLTSLLPAVKKRKKMEFNT